MKDCTIQPDLFPTVKSKKIHVDFEGGDISSDGGVLLLRQADECMGLTKALSRWLPDPRSQAHSEHTMLTLLRQRIYGIALGYEDLNDPIQLRHDLALQTAAGVDQAMGSSSTLCRMENASEREGARAFSRIMVEQFIQSYDEAPEELILDFDATDDPIYGHQQGRFFHGYYDHYCFLPLYVFCESQLLVSYLRPSNIDGARHAWAILSLLVKRFREVWPGVKIVFRGDSGFCRWRMMSWCDKHNVDYMIGIARNNRLNLLHASLLEQAKERYENTGEKQRLFTSFEYAAGTWDKPRRIIAKAEHNRLGSNPRYVVTSLQGDPQKLYDDVYCARGNMENRIKEQQLGLSADRTSCSKWWANQFRLLLSSAAYILIDYIRRNGLKATQLAQAQVQTIRLFLFKIGAVILRNTRRIYFHLSGSYAYQSLFAQVASHLNSS